MVLDGRTHRHTAQWTNIAADAHYTPDRSLDSLTLGFLKTLEKEGKFAGEIHADFPSRLINATDNSVYQVMPTAVLQPRNRNDINVVMELAGREEFSEVKITPRGGGTG